MLKHSLAGTSSTLLARPNYSAVFNPRLCVVAAAFWQEDPTFSERKWKYYVSGLTFSGKLKWTDWLTARLSVPTPACLAV